MGLLLPTQVSAADASSSYTLESVNPHHDHPQWSDLGMDQILAVSGQSNITPPSPVRLASQGPMAITIRPTAATTLCCIWAATTAMCSVPCCSIPCGRRGPSTLFVVSDSEPIHFCVLGCGISAAALPVVSRGNSTTPLKTDVFLDMA